MTYGLQHWQTTSKAAVWARPATTALNIFGLHGSSLKIPLLVRPLTSLLDILAWIYADSKGEKSTCEGNSWWKTKDSPTTIDASVVNIAWKLFMEGPFELWWSLGFPLYPHVSLCFSVRFNCKWVIVQQRCLRIYNLITGSLPSTRPVHLDLDHVIPARVNLDQRMAGGRSGYEWVGYRLPMYFQ